MADPQANDDDIKILQMQYQLRQRSAQAQNQTASAGPSMGDKTQAAVEGFGNAATLGYLPQLQAGAGKLVGRPESYTELRDQNIARLAQQAKDLPLEHYGGEVAGTLATGAAGGLAAGKLGLAAAGSRIGRVGQAIGAGGLMGAVQNPGDVQGQITPIQGKERVNNAGVGAVVGGLLQSGGELAKAGVKSLRDLAQITEKQVADALEKYGGSFGTMGGAAAGFEHGGGPGALLGSAAGLVTGKVAKEFAPLATPALQMIGKGAQALQDKSTSVYDPFIKKAGAELMTKPGLLSRILSPVNAGIISGQSVGKVNELTGGGQ